MKANKKGLYYLFCFLTTGLFFISACNQKKISPEELIQWVDNPRHGLVVTKEFDEYKISAQFRPLIYEIAIESKDENLSKENLTHKIEELGDLQYFVLRIESIDKGSDILKKSGLTQEQYSQRLQYFTTFLQHDLTLIDGMDTIPCCLFHFERNYRVAPYSNFMIGFKKNLSEYDSIKNEKEVRYNDKILVVNDNVLGIGKVVLVIKKENINSIPQMELL